MSTVEMNDRTTLEPGVQSALDALRRRIRRYVRLEGIWTAASWLGAAFWITLAGDWFFEPPIALRAAALLLVIAVLSAILMRLVVGRLMVRITDANAAIVLERRFPQFNDSLLTAVTLCGRAEAVEVEPRLLERTCREAAERLAEVDLRKVFNPRPLWTSGVAAGTLAASIVMYGFLFPEGMSVWARRVLTLSDELWPRNTRLEIEGFVGGVEKIARGADIEVVARADASMPEVPQVVEIRYRTQGGNRGRATMERRGVARGPDDRFQEYAHTFRSVLGDIHFDIVGGDDRLSGLWIQAVDSPTIACMTLDCKLPAYIGRQPSPVPVTGVMQVPVGSRVTIQAEDANKDLVEVQVGGLLGDKPISASPHGAELTPDRRGFSYTLDCLTEDTTLLFTLLDSDGIRCRDPVRLILAALPDQPPSVAVQLDGIGAAITPRARLPVTGSISDDYGIGRSWFEYTVDQGSPVAEPIAEYAGRPTDVDLAGSALEVSELGLKPGQRLTLCVRAADLCDLGRGPNVAAGDRWTLDVVAPEQLRAMLESRELVLRQRFERMIQEAVEMRDSLARMDFDKSVADSVRLLCVDGALTNCRKGEQEILGLAESFDDICKQLVNNRIDTEELQSRLQDGIAQPLYAVARQMTPELDRRLERLRTFCGDDRKGPDLRDAARRQADEIILAMQRVLDRMIELESFNEALDMLRGIIRAEQQLREDTQRRHKQRLRDLLNEEPVDEPQVLDAETLARRQRQIADDFQRFEDVLLRMAELGAAADPQRAALLKKAVAQSKDRLISMRLAQLVEMLNKDQLSRALENQAEADRDLRSLLDLLLTENRSKRIADEKTRIREFLNRLGGLIKQQKDVQARNAGDDDPQQLADQQQAIADGTGKLADDVRKQQQPGQDSAPKGDESKPTDEKDSADQSPDSASKHLDAAKKQMKQAEEKLKELQRRPAGEAQEEAIRELQTAKARLEEILRQLREEEIERTLAALEARFRKMLDMQQQVYEGTVRLDKTPPAQRTRSHEIEAGRLGGKQSEIIVELDKALVLLRDDGSAAAFLEAAEQLREDMQWIVERLSQAKVDEITRSYEEDVIAALKELIEAFKQAQKDKQQNKRPPSAQPQGMPQEPPLVDVLAELRMIRALQMRVNNRTAKYSEMIEGEQADSTELIEAIRQLAEREKRIHRITRDLQTGKNQ